MRERRGIEERACVKKRDRKIDSGRGERGTEKQELDTTNLYFPASSPPSSIERFFYFLLTSLDHQSTGTE